jgi:AcrR family transcriptional regulator
LIAAARRLFAERGYADVPADEIVAAAGVTRGALYHHFADKQALFEAVFQQFEAEITDELREAIGDRRGWEGALASIAKFMDICERPEVIRLGLTDAPAVLGWTRWREIESEHGLGLVIDVLQEMADRGELRSDAPVQVLAQLALSAVIEAALLVAHATDRPATRRAAEAGLISLVGGMLT